MGSDDYKKALGAAEKELETVSANIEILEQRRAQLQQTVAVLGALMRAFEQEERTLSDIIRIVVRAADGYIATNDILKGVISMDARFSGRNPIASVVAILSRMAKDGEIERSLEVGGGYRWKRHPLDKLRAPYKGVPAIEAALRGPKK